MNVNALKIYTMKKTKELIQFNLTKKIHYKLYSLDYKLYSLV
uniref:Uncharacterized protein n=1 Tax=Rhizophora mucronata TaxID=61149 RepID=A0A2P2IRW9_RHIMU